MAKKLEENINLKGRDFIYIIKLTDTVIYLYHQKNKCLITEDIPPNIIKNNRIYHVKKTIQTLEKIIKKNKMNNHLIRKNHIFLIDKSFSPVEIFALEYCLKALESIKYTLIKEETLIEERNALIIWQDLINIMEKAKLINIKDISKEEGKLKGKNYILYGISDKFEEHKDYLSKVLEINLLEYENSDTILFERAG